MSSRALEGEIIDADIHDCNITEWFNMQKVCNAIEVIVYESPVVTQDYTRLHNNKATPRL